METRTMLATLTAAVVAAAILRVSPQRRSLKEAGVTVLLMLISAAMLGHNFARIGAATLAAKPWLYPMQSGGLALAFVIPALWISHRQNGVAGMASVKDSGLFLLAYLAMGGVFWIADKGL